MRGEPLVTFDLRFSVNMSLIRLDNNTTIHHIADGRAPWCTVRDAQTPRTTGGESG